MKLSEFEKWRIANTYAAEIEMHGVFSDPLAAIEEAQYYATEHDQPYCVVRARDLLGVISYSDCKFRDLEWLEVVYPVSHWEAA